MSTPRMTSADITRAVLAEREACAAIADAYAEENRRMAHDTIIIDPVLAKCRPGAALSPPTAEEMQRSRDLTIDGALASAGAHTASHIAEAIRSRPAPGSEL